MIAVTILGNNSAIPAHDRHPTSQMVQTAEHSFLVDCGEGTQMQMNRYKIRRKNLNHIFISHLHGDHYFGLIGLITSFALNNRLQDLHVFSPAGLSEIIDIQLAVSSSKLPYNLIFHSLEKEAILWEDPRFSVRSFMVSHRIPCWGFLFQEKKYARKLNMDTIKNFKVPKSFYENLKKGEDFINDEKVIKNKQLTFAASPSKSYAYCADTIYDESICNKILDVDMVYHESTYLEEEKIKAGARFHSTSTQAATIAHKAGAKRLLLGHFSSMYEDLDTFREEACGIFKNTEIALEGACYIV
jgi:ribonuclease Z